MVNPFEFTRLPKICFGKGKFSLLPGILNTYRNKIILVTGKSSFSKTPQAEGLLNSLKKNGIAYQVIVIKGEPSPEMIDQAVQQLTPEIIKAVVGIGGGSVMDAGKAISAMMYKNESVLDYLEGVGSREHPGTRIPYIAIPTTSGTGSEATKNAVLSRTGSNGFKKSLRHDNFVPDVAIVDPELTINCPKNITSASGMDCFTQLTEAYLSVKANEYTDALALEGLKAVKSSLVRSYINGDDLQARTGMSFAALTSGICLANAGLGAVHGFASSIGGMYEIPHGIICGSLMAPANEITVRELRRNADNPNPLKKYSQLGKIFLNEENRSDDYYIDGFIQYIYQLSGDLQLPLLSEYELKEKDIATICANTEVKNNPVKLTPDNLSEIISKWI